MCLVSLFDLILFFVSSSLLHVDIILHLKLRLCKETRNRMMTMMAEARFGITQKFHNVNETKNGKYVNMPTTNDRFLFLFYANDNCNFQSIEFENVLNKNLSLFFLTQFVWI